MNTREHLMCYLHVTNYELQELKSISWPQNRNELNRRMSSLRDLVQSTIKELKHTEKG